MRNKMYSEERNLRIANRNEALLSMDRAKILEWSRKQIGDDSFEREDEFIFWISVHKMRTASIGLPEHERRISMKWLAQRGFEHYASFLPVVRLTAV